MTIRERLKELRENRDVTRQGDFIEWKKELNRTMFKTLAFTIGLQIAAAVFVVLLFTYGK